MPRFVVQQHDASTLHYDLRLEIAGTYVSWAVPKGPSTDPGERRLAVRVEDHGISWGNFEGRIRAGYGKGAVIVWDRGRFENAREDADLETSLEEGHIRVELHGKKLRGQWSLRRWKDRHGKEHWLLRKRRDEHAGAPLTPESVKSGRLIEQV